MEKEIEEYGKTNKVLQEEEYKKMTENNLEEEKPIDSTYYNKALLLRAFDKQKNEDDIRAMIRRSIARDQPRTMPKISKDELEKQKLQFTTKQIWDCKVPNDFHGTKIEYLIF